MDVWPYKDPEELLDYGFDWTDRLEDGETISASEWTVPTGSVTKAVSPAETFTDAITKVWLEGGTLGETCEVTNTVTTSLGRIRQCGAKLKIKVKGA